MRILANDSLRQFAGRCAGYYRDNLFFHEDCEDLRQAGYLTLAVRKELGGGGLTLAEAAREHCRLGASNQ